MLLVSEIATYLDELLHTRSVPDYPSALNGLQAENHGPIRGVAGAVDFSTRSIHGASNCNANVLLVHHGMFWGGLQPFTGAYYRKLRLLLDNDIAVYSSHLPLDRHPIFGNNVLLARELGLKPSGEFARYENTFIGVCGETDLATTELIAGAHRYSAAWGGGAHASPCASDRKTRKWGICSGAGASADTLCEARSAGIDTLIVGEGPYWTSVAADEQDLVIIYAGHYATETIGVRALAQHLGEQYSIPWTFIEVPSPL